MSESHACSFCQKPAKDSFILVAGPTCFICDQCIFLCFGIVKDALKARVATVQFPTPDLARAGA